MTRGPAVGAARWGVAVWCGLAAAACSDGNRVADRVSCYPACLADIALLCPMLSGCDTTAGTNPLISDADIATGVAACFASGEKRWEATNATTDDSIVVVKHADGSECYTATSQGASLRYTISVGGRNVAELERRHARGARGGHLQRNDDDRSRKTPAASGCPGPARWRASSSRATSARSPPARRN